MKVYFKLHYLTNVCCAVGGQEQSLKIDQIMNAKSWKKKGDFHSLLSAKEKPINTGICYYHSTQTLKAQTISQQRYKALHHGGNSRDWVVQMQSKRAISGDFNGCGGERLSSTANGQIWAAGPNMVQYSYSYIRCHDLSTSSGCRLKVRGRGKKNDYR